MSEARRGPWEAANHPPPSLKTWAFNAVPLRRGWKFLPAVWIHRSIIACYVSIREVEFHSPAEQPDLWVETAPRRLGGEAGGEISGGLWMELWKTL